MIHTLQGEFPNVPIGYSGHETGLQTTLAAVALGAVFVERHITLDRAMWGSDQAASVEPPGLQRLVRDIRVITEALGDGVKQVYEGELAAMKKLRRVPGVLAEDPRAGPRVVTTPSIGATPLALVESPAQLLNVLELAYDSPDLRDVPIAVLAPEAGPTRDQLRAMATLASDTGHEVLWYEPRLGLGGPAAYGALLGHLGNVEQLVIGDPFSGLSSRCSPRPAPVR